MAEPSEGSISSDIIGQRLPRDVLAVTSDLAMRFAQAVNDENPLYAPIGQSSNLIAPPMFSIVPAMRVLRSAMANGSLPISMKRTVHGTQDMRFLSPIQSGDVLISEGRVARVDQHSTGSTVDIEIVTTTDDDRAPRSSQVVTLFVRDRDGIREPRPISTPRDEPICAETMHVAPDQTFRYAKASFTEGIRPHEDHEFAQSLGYQTYFLQGQCTMAFATKAIVDNLADGDPARLLRVRVRFAQVVYPSDILRTQIWAEDTPGRYVFETTKEDGTAVLVDGLAEVSP